MSKYSTMQNITPIELLPELEDLERGNFGNQNNSVPNLYPVAMIPENDVTKYSKFIRNNHMSPQEAGMNLYSNQPNQQPPPPRQPQQYQSEMDNDDQISNGGGSVPKYTLQDGSPTCIDVANHIATCPICSKFYNNDKTIYIIAIILLALICILLLKKLLDV